jgi:hypothetical protein
MASPGWSAALVAGKHMQVQAAGPAPRAAAPAAPGHEQHVAREQRGRPRHALLPHQVAHVALGVIGRLQARHQQVAQLQLLAIPHGARACRHVLAGPAQKLQQGQVLRQPLVAARVVPAAEARPRGARMLASMWASAS